MKAGRTPIRTCVGCHQRKRQEDLIRLELSPEGKMRINEKRGRGGRGYYLCPNIDCFLRAREKSKISQLLYKEDLFFSFSERIIHKGLE